MLLVNWMGDVAGSVIGVSEFKSEDRGFDPLAEQGEGLFFCPSRSTLVQTSLVCA